MGEWEIQLSYPSPPECPGLYQGQRILGLARALPMRCSHCAGPYGHAYLVAFCSSWAGLQFSALQSFHPGAVLQKLAHVGTLGPTRKRIHSFSALENYLTCLSRPFCFLTPHLPLGPLAYGKQKLHHFRTSLSFFSFSCEDSNLHKWGKKRKKKDVKQPIDRGQECEFQQRGRQCMEKNGCPGREGEGRGNRKAQNLTRVSQRSWILKIGYNFPGWSMISNQKSDKNRSGVCLRVNNLDYG